MNIPANVLVCPRSSGWLSALGLFLLMTLGCFGLPASVGVSLWGDVAGVWGMWGGPWCCPWDSQGDGDAVSLSFFLLWLFGQEWGVTLGDRGSFGVVLCLGRVAGLQIWKGGQK